MLYVNDINKNSITFIKLIKLYITTHGHMRLKFIFQNLMLSIKQLRTLLKYFLWYIGKIKLSF